MNSIDTGVETGLSMSIEATKLTGQIIIESLNATLALVKKNRKTTFQEAKTDQGKMKLNKLFEKHNNSEIISLEDNISKDEYIALKKEFKKMGVDFSIRKIGNNEYSLFFASKDAMNIEKGMENAIKKYSKKQEKKEELTSKFKITNLRDRQKTIDKNNKKKEFTKHKLKDSQIL